MRRTPGVPYGNDMAGASPKLIYPFPKKVPTLDSDGILVFAVYLVCQPMHQGLVYQLIRYYRYNCL